MYMYALGAILLSIYYALGRITAFAKALTNNDKRFPRLLTTIQPLSVMGIFLPKSPFHRGIDFAWAERNSMYKDSQFETVVVLPLLYGRDMIYTRSLALLHQCMALNAPFEKPDMSVLEICGVNVVTSSGDIWKRHRRITAPAFNHTTYRNVWDTVVNVYSDIVKEEGWSNVDETQPTDFNIVTHKVALFLVSIVGFGLPMSWSAPDRDANGRLSTQAMIFRVASSIVERSQLPRWSYLLGRILGIKSLNDIDEAYTTFETFMHERIIDRESELKKLRAMAGGGAADANEEFMDCIKDIFGRLVNSRLSDGKNNLSDNEIIGNCFFFTFAGHETTAGTLAMALALLALNPDKQDWVFNSIKDVIGDRAPTFDDYDALENVLACFYEAARLFPVAHLTARTTSKDVTVLLPRTGNPEVVEQLFLKKGTSIGLDMIGMFYDPQTFPDPETFNPQRWIESRDSSTSTKSSSITKDTEAGEISSSSPASTLDGFIGFSFGPRTCLGHKFAKVEAVAFLTLLLKDWVVFPALNVGETKEMWRERVLQPYVKATALCFKDVPLKLIRRK